MIRRHDFNSRWWNAEVGILEDEAFFELEASRQQEALRSWAWVERRQTVDAVTAFRIARAGFAQVDTQIGFRIGLKKLASSASVEQLRVEFADERPFSAQAEELPAFRNERFLALPGSTLERVNQRYGLWAQDLIEEHPATCLRVLDGDRVQGWFLSRRLEKGLELTLAMLHREATITGHGLYHRALLAYGARGHRAGTASFSVTNTAVHGIYASLGARFLPPLGCWLWFPAS